MRKRKAGFTLLEIIVVVIIIGIITSFALPAFRNVQIRAREREGRTSLSVMQAAQEVLLQETGNYSTCADTADCRASLNLPDLVGTNWAFTVPSVNNAATPHTFCAQAAPTFRGGGTWRIDQDDQAAVAGACP